MRRMAVLFEGLTCVFLGALPLVVGCPGNSGKKISFHQRGSSVFPKKIDAVGVAPGAVSVTVSGGPGGAALSVKDSNGYTSTDPDLDDKVVVPLDGSEEYALISYGKYTKRVTKAELLGE